MKAMITKEEIKNTGATFTPKKLSDFLALRISSYIKLNNQCVLDPACGEGELLVALREKLYELNIDFTLTGYDSNSHYLNVAKKRVKSFKSQKTNLVQEDFLEAIEFNHEQGSLNLFSETKTPINDSFDIVIANPPYVRTQILGSMQAQKLAKKFNLKGRVDLYYPFLIAMTKSLKVGGVIGVITSNRYLFTKSGASIRKFLSENFEILELIDLGDTKLFNAAVLPAIFIGRKIQPNKPSSSARFTKIYEELSGSDRISIPVDDVYDILLSNKSGYFKTGEKRYKKTIGKLKYNIASTSSWEMLSREESDWISTIESSANSKVKDSFKVRVGIKSTADKIFISDKWDELGINKPEPELLKELISQENIGRWNASVNQSLKVLYPYVDGSDEKQAVDINDYPKAKKYLELHEEKLKSRKYLIDAGRHWFELWVPHKPHLWGYSKIVFPDISVNPRFCFDRCGRIVNGNCYWIVASNDEDLEKLLLIQGISNSNLMTKYHDLVFNNKLYSGRRRYFSQYVENYPLPDYTSTVAKEIIEIAQNLNEINDYEAMRYQENILEEKVAESFGVDPIFSLD